MSTDTNPPSASQDESELRRQVEALIQDFLREELGVERASLLKEDDKLWSELDSMLVLELVSQIEDKYDVEIASAALSRKDLSNLASVIDVAVRGIEEARAARR